jgi:predicted ATP-dependent serine protease
MQNQKPKQTIADKPKEYKCEDCGNRYTGFCDNCTTLNIAGSLPSNFCPRKVGNGEKEV